MGLLSVMSFICFDINLSNVLHWFIDISIVLLITIILTLHALHAIWLQLVLSFVIAIGESILAIICHLELSGHQTIALCVTHLKQVPGTTSCQTLVFLSPISFTLNTESLTFWYLARLYHPQ